MEIGPNTLLLSIAGFFICSGFIFYSGKKLSHYGDIIALESGLGRIWIGLFLMATVTSLPELFIGISSVTIVNSADLATGNVLGSCTFNLAILSLMDAIMPGQPLLTKAARSHTLAASLCTILLCLVGIGLFLPEEYAIMDWIGITSIGFIIVYLISLKLLSSFGVAETIEIVHVGSETPAKKRNILRNAILWYSFHALIVIAAALALPYFSEAIAMSTGMKETFVATLFLAASSSLPEIAVSISAVRTGAIDMAVGNLFGSNIFNILLLSISDLFYLNGNLLKDASAENIISVFAIIIMNAVAIIGLTIKPSKKSFKLLAWDTLIILLVYLFNITYLYLN